MSCTILDDTIAWGGSKIRTPRVGAAGAVGAAAGVRILEPPQAFGVRNPLKRRGPPGHRRLCSVPRGTGVYAET